MSVFRAYRAALAATGFLAATACAQDIETVAELPADTPPGNIAVCPDGRIVMSVHEFYGPSLRIVAVAPDGSTTPYPNEDWANAPVGDGPGLRGVLGLRCDRDGVLWMLDGAGEGQAGRLVAWDTQADELHRIIYLAPPIIGPGAFLNDLAVDRDNEAIYIADTASPDTAALIVVDLKTGRARRVLEGSPFTRPEDIDMVIDDRLISFGADPVRIGVNPITIDPANAWIYFAPMSGTALYRVKTADVLNEALTSQELEQRVERYGDKPISDGITIDGAGNVYVTSITDESIGVVRPDGSYDTLFQRDDISWPDGFAFGPDDTIYVTINELHRSPVLNGGQNAARGEFKIMRFGALAPGANGR